MVSPLLKSLRQFARLLLLPGYLHAHCLYRSMSADCRHSNQGVVMLVFQCLLLQGRNTERSARLCLRPHVLGSYAGRDGGSGTSLTLLPCIKSSQAGGHGVSAKCNTRVVPSRWKLGPGPGLVSMDLAMFSVTVEGKSVRHSPFEQSVALGVGETASSNHDGGIIWIRLTVLVSRGFFGLGRSSWD